MSIYTLRPWTELVSLNPDVESDNLTESVFAIDLGAIAAGDKNVPAVNRDAEAFFRATYLTTDLRRLLEEVLAALAGDKRYNRVLKLRTPFGGGKSHTLAALLHASRNRKSLDIIPEAKGFADPGDVKVAVFDGEKFSAQGKEVKGKTIHTMWGWLAYQLGDTAYTSIEKLDRDKVSPSGDDIQKMLAGGPKLILLDEVLKYIERASAVAVVDSTLGKQAKDFIQNLTVEVANSQNAVMVYSLQWSAREALGSLSLLNELDKLTSRVDDLRQPVGDDEIVHVVKRRLLSGEIDSSLANEIGQIAQVYQEAVTKERRATASNQLEREQFEQEGNLLKEQIKACYPFHPATIDVMRGRWASVEAFQRTRGALRFLGTCLRATKKGGVSRALLGPGDIPIQNIEVRTSLQKELGLNNDYDAIFHEDIAGANARVKRIDDRLGKEYPKLANVKPATRLATAIFMYSFGGLKRDGSSDSDMLPPGITEQELLSICLSPELDNLTARSVLSELKTTCLYLHYDGVRYVFKKDPNVTKLVEEAEKSISDSESKTGLIKNNIERLLASKLAGKNSAIIWPDKPAKVPDKEPIFLLGYLPLDFVDLSTSDQEKQAKEIFEKYGDRQRLYRNGIGLVIPQKSKVASLQKAVSYLLAVEKVETNKSQHRLTKDQLDQLKDRRRKEETSIEADLKELYATVWLPSVDGGQITIEKVEGGNRPLQSSNVHERMIELVTVMNKKVFSSIKSTKIVERLKLGDSTDGQPSRLGIKASEVQDAFYSILSYPRLDSSNALKKAIAEGVANSLFGYTAGLEPKLGSDGRYQVSRERVFFGRSLSDSEVDFESGFLIMPEAIPLPPQEKPSTISNSEVNVENSTSLTSTESSNSSSSPVVVGANNAVNQPTKEPQKVSQNNVRFTIKVDRDKLFSSWQAIANLADMADELEIEISASNKTGFDQNKLRNAVFEPLDEADVEVNKG